MKKNIASILIVALAASPVLVYNFLKNSIPEPFVFEFDLNERIEKIHTRNELLMAIAVISAVSIFIYLLLLKLYRIDPKVTAETPRSAFNKLGMTICLFFVAINYYLLLSAKNQWIVNTGVITSFFGLLVTLLGNYMNNIKPNYVAGIRLPWTLKDPDNWRRTHHLAARIWFAAGILIILLSFLLAKKLLLVMFIVIIVLITVIPGVYSFRIHRKKTGAL